MIKFSLIVVFLCCFFLSSKYASGDFFCDESNYFLESDFYENIGNERVFSPEKAVKLSQDVKRAKREYCSQLKKEQKKESNPIIPHETKECFPKCDDLFVDKDKIPFEPTLEKLAPELNFKKIK